MSEYTPGPRVKNGPCIEEDAEANASLIAAAAPQMLEALEIACKYLHAHAERTSDKYAIKDLATVKAAIAAAKGEA